jgi:hypothetical protein
MTFLVPAKTASAVARGRGQGRPMGRRAWRASLDGGEHGRTLVVGGIMRRKPRAWRATIGLLFLCASPTSVLAGSVQVTGSAFGEPSIASIIEAASARYELPARWVQAVVVAESGGRIGAVSSKGAMGLMQLMPATWRELRADLSLGSDPFDRRDNVLAGTAYLRRLYDQFGRRGFLAAYNAGPSRYQDYVKGRRALPAETVTYVSKVERAISGQPTDRGQQGLPPLDWRTSALFTDQGGQTSGTVGAEASNALFPRLAGADR